MKLGGMNTDSKIFQQVAPQKRVDQSINVLRISHTSPSKLLKSPLITSPKRPIRNEKDFHPSIGICKDALGLRWQDLIMFIIIALTLEKKDCSISATGRIFMLWMIPFHEKKGRRLKQQPRCTETAVLQHAY